MTKNPITAIVLNLALIAGLVLPVAASQGVLSRPAAQTRLAPTTEHQICYAVADAGGGPPGDDLLSMVDYEAGTETVIGSTGTSRIEAMTFQLETEIMFAADAGQLGTIDLETGLFTPHPQPFGVGNGELGPITIGDVDGLSFHPTTGVLYGTHRREQAPEQNDLLVQINVETGAIIPDAFGPGIDYLVIRAGEVTGLYDIDDIAFDVLTNELYAINNSFGLEDMLVILDPDSGEIVEVIGQLTVDDMEGLTFDTTGLLLGTTGKDGGENRDRLWQIDKATGVADIPSSVPLTGGADYEAVDCLASPPSAVELLFFILGDVAGQQVTLEWETAIEVNHAGFKIYRSPEALFSGATVVHFEPARPGFTASEYSFTDLAPDTQSNWWYWLASVDLDGRETRFGPLEVELELKAANIYQVYLPLGLR
jgi:hypothetical protein